MTKSTNPRLRSGCYATARGNPDHARRRQVPAPSDAEIEQRLNELVKPAVFAELAHYRQLGRRERVLSLPVMVSLVLAMLWRQIPGVMTLQRLLGGPACAVFLTNREGTQLRIAAGAGVADVAPLDLPFIAGELGM